MMVVPHTAPLRLSLYKTAEVAGGLPLGDSAVRDVSEEALLRRLQWLLVMANQPGLVGTVHRFLATLDGPHWVEPTPALSSAVATLQWQIWVNRPSSRASGWPHLAPELAYPGVVLLEPQDELPPLGTVWTDGSLAARGAPPPYRSLPITACSAPSTPPGAPPTVSWWPWVWSATSALPRLWC